MVPDTKCGTETQEALHLPVTGPTRTLAARIYASTAAFLVSRVINVATSLLLVPLYLSHWSQGYYGEWLALSSLVTYFTLFDFGLNMAATNRLTQSYARGEFESYARYQHSALAFYVSAATVATILMTAIALLFPIADWLGIRQASPTETRWAFAFLGLQIVWAMPLGFIVNTYRTVGNLAFSVWISNAQAIFMVLVIVLVITNGGHMREVAGAQLFFNLAAGLLVLFDIHRRMPEVMPGLRGARISTLKELIKPSLLFGLLTISNAISYQGPMILVIRGLGGTTAAVFGTARTLVGVVRQVVTTFTASFQPELTILGAKADWKRLRLLHRLLVMSSLAICSAFVVVLWFEGPTLLSIWTNHKLAVAPNFLRLLLLHVLLQAPWLASSMVPAALNQHRIMTYAQISSSIVGVVCVVGLLDWFGLSAVPIGLMIGEALCCYHFLIRDSCRQVREDYADFAKRLFRIFGSIGVIAFPLVWAAEKFAIGPVMLRWCELGFVSLLATTTIVWFIGLDAEERELTINRLTSLSGRFPFRRGSSATLRRTEVPPGLP